MNIVVKYCGGCNPQIDRSKIIKDVENSLTACYQLTTNKFDAPFDAGILICGCLSACARKPELIDLTKYWVVIAGKTMNHQELPEHDLAAAVVQKINEIKKLKKTI